MLRLPVGPTDDIRQWAQVTSPADANNPQLLIDLHGVLEVGGEVVPGAPDVLQELRRFGCAFRVFTNTTTQSRSRLADHLSRLGMPVLPDELHTAAEATARYLLGAYPQPSILFHGDGEPFADHPGIAVSRIEPGSGERLDVGVLGGATPDMTIGSFELFCDTVKRRGLPLITMHQNVFERRKERMGFDSGVFAPHISRVCDTKPMLMGKPSTRFFRTAVGTAPPSSVMVVGDDFDSDVVPAIALGYKGVLVTRSGKPAPKGSADSAVYEIDDIRSLPAIVAEWLAQS